MKLFTIVIISLWSTTSFGEQKSWVQIAVDDMCVTMYQASKQGNASYTQALEDLKNSVNIDNYRVKVEASRNVLIEMKALDAGEDMISPIITRALRLNLSNQPFDAYIATIAEKAQQKALAGQK